MDLLNNIVLFLKALSLIWIVVLICVLVFLSWVVYKLYKSLLQKNKAAEKHLEMVKTQTQLQYNKVVSMTPKDLDEYLMKTFITMLQLASSSDISEKDPNGQIKLYGYTLTRMINYLGAETMKAIEYFYGIGYVHRWCEVTYKTMVTQNTLSKYLKNTDFTEIE